MNLKIVYNGETKRVPKLPDSFAALQQAIKSAFQENNLPSTFVAKYYDADGDLITVSAQEDFEAMVGSGTNPIKLYVLAPGQAPPIEDPWASQSISSVRTGGSKKEFKKMKVTEPELGPLSSEDDDEDDEDDDQEDAELAAEEKEANSSSDEDDDEASDENYAKKQGKGSMKFEKDEEEKKEAPRPHPRAETQKGHPGDFGKNPEELFKLKEEKWNLKNEIRALKERKEQLKKFMNNTPEGGKSSELKEELNKLKKQIHEQKENLDKLKKKIKKAKKGFKKDFKGWWKKDRPRPQHEGVECDSCHVSPIVGPRFKCLDCQDYDLCRRCYNNPLLNHPDTHRFEKVRPPGWIPHGPHGYHHPPPPFGHHGPGPFPPPQHFGGGPHGPHGPHHPPPPFGGPWGHRGPHGPHGPFGGRGKLREIIQQLQQPGGPERLAQQYGPLLQQYRPLIQQYAPFIEQFMAGVQQQQPGQANQQQQQQQGPVNYPTFPSAPNMETVLGIEWRQASVHPANITTDSSETVEVVVEVTNRAPNPIPANTYLVYMAGHEGSDMIPLPQLKPGEKTMIVLSFKNPKKVGKFESIYKCVVTGAGEQEAVSQCSVTFEVKQGKGSKEDAIVKAKYLQEIFSSRDFDGLLKFVEEHPTKSENELIDLLLKTQDDLYD